MPDATIVVSQALREHYLRVDGRCPEYVPNGVVPPTPRRRQQIDTQLPLHGRPFALFVGRLVPEKAPHTLVRAFAEIPGDMALVVAGGTSFSDEYVRSLRALAAADDRVILAGYVYGALLQELYTNAELFVLPSVLEGLPLTLLEAASYGTPAVASAIPAHLEVLGQGAPGRRLFPPGDEAALAAELKAAFAGGEAERRGARALQAHVLETYRWDDVAAATDRIYASVLAG